MTMVGAVVVGGDYRGLGIVRSLGRRGVPVWVVHDGDTIARYSRYCRRAFRWRTGQPLVTSLIKLADDHHLDGWVLFPTSDETAWVLSRHWDELATRFRLTVPRWNVYCAAADKRQLHSMAATLGVHTPRCWFPRSAADVDTLDIDTADFPVVIKPTRRESVNALTADKAWRVDDRAALTRRYSEAITAQPPDAIMIQRWVPGSGEHQYAFAAVCSAGEPKVSVAARRTRQYPRDFGRASCFVETIDHPDLVKEATRLLSELRVDGLVEVEFKQDESAGTLELLDVNVRAWGWHSLGAAAGVDFSHAAYRLALGEQLPNRTGSPGRRWTRLAIDVPYALADVAAGRMRITDLIRSLRPPLEGPIAAVDDPLPALMELPLLARTTLRQWRSRRSKP